MVGEVLDQAILEEMEDTLGTDFALELIETFLGEAPGMITELRGAANGNDADAFRRAAHSIKSNANTFGATRLANLARDLETGGFSGDPSDLDALEDAAKAAITALKDYMDG